jgi:hypothetical protein
MDQTPQQPPPSAASPGSQEPQPAPAAEPKKKRPLTPAELSKRYMQEGATVFLVFLWFAYDGWFSTEISEHGRSFSQVGAVLLGYWVAHCCYFALKHRRAARSQPQTPKSDTSNSPP